MLKRYKIPIILMIVGVLLIVIAIIISKSNPINSKIKGKVYCSDGAMCYTYDGLHLKYYEDTDETEDNHLDLLWYSCIYTNIFKTCKERIIEGNEKVINVKKKENGEELVVAYHNVNEEKAEYEQIDMTGKAYKNTKLDLYFVTENSVIVSGKNKSQEKCDYYLEANEYDKYTSIRYECPNKNYDKEDIYNTYSYNIKEEKIIGFKKTTKEKLTHIDFSYYDENYNYIPKEFKSIDGHYRIENNPPYTFEEDVWVNGEEFRIKTASYDKTDIYKILEYNDKFILYYNRGAGARYYYNLEKDTLCKDSTCFNKD